jgi:hypothetical protein
MNYSLDSWVLDCIDACHLNLAWDVCCLLRWSNGASLNFRDRNRTVVKLDLTGASVVSREKELYETIKVIQGCSWGKACALRDLLIELNLIKGV